MSAIIAAPAGAVQPRDAAAVAAPDSAAPPLAPTQEVRFAVVMYGGVSLAIYINGVARELFRLVQSTAPERRRAERSTIRADGTAAVYRKLGQLLDGGRLRTELCELRGGYVVVRSQHDGTAPPIRTRFVVDVLSGTSAGGINAVYLAKALANDGDFEVLRDLWLGEADIDVLIHDAGSHAPEFRSPARPAAVLNGNRMYARLLDALRQVGAPREEQSRLVEELDLFVTATDVRGLPVEVALDDVVVEERRHRNVFRFRYVTKDAGGGRDHNDFVPANDPFLAFAARCTSAFPGAFEPMCLADVRQALPEEPSRSAWAQRPEWTRFHGDYDADGFDTRAFQDGGSLDNKPFTHALEALAHRRADVPVDRKLLYIEPVPEIIGRPGAAAARKPDMLANVAAALIGLPRYETVREDLERVFGRNRLIGRVAHVLQQREEDVLHRQRVRSPAARTTTKEWATRDLSLMIEEHGIAYGAYHRLRVATVLDDLSELIGRLAGFTTGSAEHRGVRRLVEAWENARYATYHTADRETENAFLVDYDLAWWLRRFAFMQEKTGELLRAGTEDDVGAALRAHPHAHALASAIRNMDAAERALFDAALRRIRSAVNDAYVHLRARGRALRSRAADNPLRRHIAALGIGADELRALAALRQRECAVYGGALAARARSAIDALAADVRDGLATAIRPAGNAVRFILALHDWPPVLDVTGPVLEAGDVAYFNGISRLDGRSALAPAAAQRALAFYYGEFEYYDLIAFPILHEAGVGEADVVDVIRFSPLDTERLVPDRSARRRKLAGTAFGNFGAFLERDWRVNDMVWGRLDAAERILNALLPAAPLTPQEQAIRDALLDELHDVIFAEEGVERATFLARVGQRSALDRERAVGAVARSLRVLGHVVQGVAEARGRRGAPATWPRRAANVAAFTALATVPGRKERTLSHIIIGGCYAAAALLLALGLLRPAVPAVAAGVLALGAAVAGHLVLAGMRRVLRGRHAALLQAGIAAGLTLAVAVGVAAGVLAVF